MRYVILNGVNKIDNCSDLTNINEIVIDVINDLENTLAVLKQDIRYMEVHDSESSATIESSSDPVFHSDIVFKNGNPEEGIKCILYRNTEKTPIEELQEQINEIQEVILG